MNRLPAMALGFVLLTASGCAAVQTAVSHSDLDVQSKMSATVFLDPVGPQDKTIFVQVRNTSDQPSFDLSQDLTRAIAAKGYTIVADPHRAHYLLQTNVLQVGKMSPSAAQEAFAGGYGSMFTGAAAGALIGSTTGSYGASVAGGLVGGAAALVADSAVKDVTYTVITDLQISERSGVPVTQTTQQNLAQGTAGTTNVYSQEKTNWKRYQTRVMSTANKVNLDLPEALPALKSGMVRSIAGIF